MPLTPELEALLAVAPADKREGLRKELEAGYLRQSDYSRKMNELSESDKTRADAYAQGINWVETHKQNYAQAISDRDLAIQKALDAEKLATSLNAGAPPPNADLNINMDDPAQVEKAIRSALADAAQARSEAAKLSATVLKIDKMVADGDLVTASRFEQEAGKRLEAFSRATMDVMGTLAKAKSEYGLDVDREVLLNEAAKYGGDLSKAYEAVTQDARVEKMRTDIRNEVTKEFEAKYANGQGSPLATGGQPLMGPLQQRVFSSANPETTIDASIPADGSGRLAHAIAAELRSEGKY